MSTSNQSDKETSDKLRTKVLQKYNNMLQVKRWKRTGGPSVKVISALVIQVTNLEDKLSKENGYQANATSDKSLIILRFCYGLHE